MLFLKWNCYLRKQEEGGNALFDLFANRDLYSRMYARLGNAIFFFQFVIAG